MREIILRVGALPYLTLALSLTVNDSRFHALSIAAAISSRHSQFPCPRRRRAPAPTIRPSAPAAPSGSLPHAPVRIFGNVYFVGTNGITSLLITSSEGHILIDAGLPDAAPIVLANIRTLGFRARDVKLILNSHAHFDHAGGIAAVQRATGARVAASAPSDSVLRRGNVAAERSAVRHRASPYPPVSNPARHRRRRHGARGLTRARSASHGGAHARRHHVELALVRRRGSMPRLRLRGQPDSHVGRLASSTRTTRRTPTLLDDFAHGAAVLESLPCDVLLTPHPGASHMWERIGTPALVDTSACKRLAATAREALAKRIASEH